VPVDGKPRLWLTQADLPKLQSWAVSSNPIFATSLQTLLTKRLSDYDTKFFPSGKAANPFPDAGGSELTSMPSEEYAVFFAFMSLITTDQTKKDDYAHRARTLLMYVMDQAVKGASAGQPFRDPTFSWKDRARWSGEDFPLTVDWIYPYLTAADKTEIKTVFLRWASEQVGAFATTRPAGVQNSASLTSDRKNLRWAANNYYQSGERNMTLESLALLPADDADGTLQAVFKEAVGGMLYQTYALFSKGDCAGGVPTEGAFFYGQESVSFTTSGLLGLETAGFTDPTMFGAQVGLGTDDYWNKMVQFYPSAIAPAPQSIKGLEYLGPAYWSAEMEQTQDQILTGDDPVAQLAPIALIARRRGNTDLEKKISWFLQNALPGGTAKLTTRAGDNPIVAILSFMLFDPTAAAPADYRTSLPTTFYSPAIRRLEARTSWSSDASWFGYSCNWKTIDHQTDICGGFHFYRKGEWITKTRTGYSNTGLLDAPDYWNAMGVQNNAINVGWEQVEFDHGGPLRESAGDPSAVVSLSDAFVYVQGDSSNLYMFTSPSPGSDVTHVSRAIAWIKPDTIVIYDRATTKTAGRFKHWNLDLPATPTISGTTVKSMTAKGQLLRVDSVLPASPTITVQPWESDSLLSDPEMMVTRIRIEPNTAASTPTDVRFLTTLQTTDGADVAAPTAVKPTGGAAAFDGAAVGATAVLFSVNITPASAVGLTFTLPSTVTHTYVTGLNPGDGYTVTKSGSTVTLSAGSQVTADSGGVISF
jgi:hypothetical protein